MVYDERRDCVARTPFDSPRDLHNARLIAAAPDMLECLEMIECLEELVPHGVPGAVYQKCRAVIAKAQGEGRSESKGDS